MKPDTLENHYCNLLIGAEDWAIEQVKEDIQRLRKENATLKQELNDLGNRYEEMEEKNEVLKGDLRFALDPVEKLQKENAELKKELGMLRELVGVRADASACAEDAHHWLKLMKAWDNNIKLRSVLSEVDEVLTELGWHSDRGVLVRIRRVLESTKNEADNAEKVNGL